MGLIFLQIKAFEFIEVTEIRMKRTSKRKATQSDPSTQTSKRKRGACFLDLDPEPVPATKKTCVSASFSPTSSWRTPLAKLWEICSNISGARFSALYEVGKLLGQGSFGSVHAGTRKADGKKVALKFISKADDDEYLTFPGTSLRLPMEVALHMMVSRPPACDQVVELLEWFDQPERVVLVMEHPVPCVDVNTFMNTVARGAFREDVARVIMRQAALACRHCRDRGVLHRDVKGENLLVRTDNLRVKLIDFGCGDLLKEEPYNEFAGTMEYFPPEFFTEGMYDGCKATVWSLGILLFYLVNGKTPFRDEYQIASRSRLYFKQGISEECRDLIHRNRSTELRMKIGAKETSKRKRGACFLDLDPEPVPATKKTCVSASFSPTSSWRTPLAKLWEICSNISGDRFSALYEVGKLLGQGSFGSVHAGTRKADGKKVALKFISKADDDEYLTFPGTSLRLPMEVALHMMVSRPPACDPVVELLEWFDQPFRDEYQIASRSRLYFKQGISEECRDLIHRCLRKDFNARPTLEDILEHDWLLNTEIGPQN
ncbi:hypothetical protein DPEC_G00089660 [Dallia pectoralis]|uniref:Uncharacterized protein n=1 Tax=Dallia pectoralis TaxID=75939 RepID=A0ACC2H0W2_DALPE|nr:hypothetical protein DPEC_G00089660 [Dallia pectoralis]